MPRKKKQPIKWPTDEHVPRHREEREGAVHRGSLVLMSCSSRFTTWRFEDDIKYFMKGKNANDPQDYLAPGSGTVYLLVHDTCTHPPTVMISNNNNNKYPGVPRIFTFMYFRQGNGVYCNAIGEIMKGDPSFSHGCTGNKLVQFKNVVAQPSPKDSFSFHSTFHNTRVKAQVRKEGHDIDLFRQFRDEWVSLKN